MVKLQGFRELVRDCVMRGVEEEERGRGGKAQGYYSKAAELADEALLIPVPR